MGKAGGLHKGYRNIPKEKKFRDDKQKIKDMHSCHKSKVQYRSKKKY
jgi:hypothetical protein